jgi:glycosyltransferase involved in cell wall biosynthesis
MDRFYFLSETLQGDVLQPVWFHTREEVEAEFGPGSYPVYTRGRFRYHWYLAWPSSGLRSRLKVFWFYLRHGLRLLKEQEFDCIVAYSHMTTGVMAACLKLLSGVPLVIELVIAPELAYVADTPRPGLRGRLLRIYSDICLYLTAGLADRIHFLYPDALASYRWLRRRPNSVFHEFVPISSIGGGCQERAQPFVLLVGAPWYRKGADLLVKAFQRVAGDFPQFSLKLLGYYPDRDGLDRIIGNTPRIEILKARPNPETLAIMRQAALFALPSRNEGLPRVLLEAMAAGVPVLASDVAGIPFLLRGGECGWLFPTGDLNGLEERLRESLGDAEARSRMGERAYRRVHTDFNERVYVDAFTTMIEAAADGRQ